MDLPDLISCQADICLIIFIKRISEIMETTENAIEMIEITKNNIDSDD